MFNFLQLVRLVLRDQLEIQDRLDHQGREVLQEIKARLAHLVPVQEVSVLKELQDCQVQKLVDYCHVVV